MNHRSLKIALISDLHCHPTNKVDEGKINKEISTYLLTDMLRTPSNNHPVESLLNIIKNEKLEVDLTLCPGDFTDKASIQGLISGWGYSLEINRELKSKDIIATVGNHDVDVYAKNNNYSLKSVKGLKRNFPFKNVDKVDQFWSKGCAFLEHENYRVLVINSSHFHYNKESSYNGEISADSLDYIKDYMSENKDDKIQIAMSHHPPISHPNKNLGEDDKIVNGHELLNILGEFSFDLFIYGHKHHPFLKNENTLRGNYIIPLFSSGSFSAGTNLMFSGVRNAFHILELKKVNNECKGKIRTWTFLPNKGWESNYDQSAFAPMTGFGSSKSVDQIYDEIKNNFKTKKKIYWPELTKTIEDIDYLIPEDSKKLNELLKSNGWIPDEHIWQGPQFLFNTNL